MDQIASIVDYIIESFLKAWPYLLLTIPISVAVKMSGASKLVNKALTSKPILAILLSTLVGAFSPLCSCTVIPVIASLLIGGVPLAPVMSFWLASPSMDPEIFLLTVSSLGWELAVWRLAATLVLSLGGGLFTLFLSNRGWIGTDFIRDLQSAQITNIGTSLKDILNNVSQFVGNGFKTLKVNPVSIPVTIPVTITQSQNVQEDLILESPNTADCCDDDSNENSSKINQDFWKRLLIETKDASLMVFKFMLLAWILGGIIRLYVPESWITSVLGNDNPFSIFTAALLGIPTYTSSLAAMPLVGGLLAQGMSPAAALSFLIAGPTTTLPAMSAVWGLVNRKVFAIYVGFSLFGAIILAYVYKIFL